MNFPRNNIPEKVQATDEEDGTPIPEPRMMSCTIDKLRLKISLSMSYAQNRKIMVQQKQTQALQERVSSPTRSNSPQRKLRAGTTPNKLRNTKFRQSVRGNNRNNPNFIPNPSVDEHYEEPPNANSVNQNLHQQFPNTTLQRQQQPVARPPLPTPPQAPPVQESHSQCLIQRRPRDRPQVQHPFPQFLHSSEIQNIIDSASTSEEFTDSIRMLVLLDDGEQRLITFTVPEEACTIREILEQVDVPFTNETPIQVSEVNSNGVNYIVAVGNIPGLSLEPAPQEEPHDNENSQPQQVLQVEQKPDAAMETSKGQPPLSPDLLKESPPRIVEGQLAVCAICGYLSEDFSRCNRCNIDGSQCVEFTK